MYFRLKHSTDKKIVGKCESQTVHATYPVSAGHPLLSKQYYLRRADTALVIMYQNF